MTTLDDLLKIIGQLYVENIILNSEKMQLQQQLAHTAPSEEQKENDVQLPAEDN